MQEAIYERFTMTFAERARQIEIGVGLDPDTQMGPVANDRRLAAMEMFVADARAKGARIVAGGSRIGNRGYFHELTVLADVPDAGRGRQPVDQPPDRVVRRNVIRRRQGFGLRAREGGTEGLECCTVAENVSHLVL